jgi:hypothetical protein
LSKTYTIGRPILLAAGFRAELARRGTRRDHEVTSFLPLRAIHLAPFALRTNLQRATNAVREQRASQLVSMSQSLT